VEAEDSSESEDNSVEAEDSSESEDSSVEAEDSSESEDNSVETEDDNNTEDLKNLYVEAVNVNDPEVLLELLSTVPDDVLEEVIAMLSSSATSTEMSSLVGYSSQFEDIGLFDSASLAYGDADKVDELMNNKLTHLAELETQITQAEGKLADLTNEIAGYNWYGDASDEVESLISSLDENMSDDEISAVEAQLETLKEDSVINKWEDGLVPYKDTDDDEWFTGHVWSLTDAGVVSGGTGVNEGYYVPSNDVTVAEVLKMALETAGYGPSDATPANPNAQSHWAAGYYAQAESLGLAIVSNTDRDPNSAATRAEVINTLFDAYGVSIPEASTMQFSDVDSNHAYANAIQYAYELGIVSGDDGLGVTFRPDDSINRAEAAKIVDEFMGTMVITQ